MSFTNLFTLYIAFMGDSDMRHEDMVKPILSYAKEVGMPALFVVQSLHNMFINR